MLRLPKDPCTSSYRHEFASRLDGENERGVGFDCLTGLHTARRPAEIEAQSPRGESGQNGWYFGIIGPFIWTEAQ